MELATELLFLVLGLVLLFFGSEWLVKGSSELALRLGVSPLVIGLTIVAFGTSAPELLASVTANLADPPQGGLAIGNVVGSNICNIGLVLGLTALLKPLVVNRQVIVRDMPLLLVTTLIFLWFLSDGAISRAEGVTFTVGVVAYTVISLIISRRSGKKDSGLEMTEEEISEAKKGGVKKTVIDIALIIVGLLLLVKGADLLVDSGMVIARSIGVPEAVIGLTMIALGTSLPELATSIAAVRKGEIDIITGNAIGSCVFNLLAVIGITALISPIKATAITSIDLYTLLGITVAVVVLGFMGSVLSRWQGAVLLTVYLVYTAYLGLQTLNL